MVEIARDEPSFFDTLGASLSRAQQSCASRATSSSRCASRARIGSLRALRELLDTPLPLEVGWNYLPYLPHQAADLAVGMPSLNVSPAFWSATRSSPAAARPPRALTERGSPPPSDDAEDRTFVITQTAKFSTIDLSARLARGLGAD